MVFLAILLSFVAFVSYSQPTEAYSITASAPYKKGTVIYTRSNAYRMAYKVTSSNKKNPQVTCLATYGWAEHIIIPPKIKVYGITYKVTAIAKNAFRGYTPMTSVTIGKNVKKIGDNAFKNATNLEQLRITSKELTSLGNNVLEGDEKLTRIITKSRDVCNMFREAVKDAGLDTVLQ